MKTADHRSGTPVTLEIVMASPAAANLHWTDVGVVAVRLRQAAVAGAGLRPPHSSKRYTVRHTPGSDPSGPQALPAAETCDAAVSRIGELALGGRSQQFELLAQRRAPRLLGDLQQIVEHAAQAA